MPQTSTQNNCRLGNGLQIQRVYVGNFWAVPITVPLLSGGRMASSLNATLSITSIFAVLRLHTGASKMQYCIVFNTEYIIGPFYSMEAALKYVETDTDLNSDMIQVMQDPFNF
jgi:hypothetical protein